ncbi:MAG: protein-disulfide reductase DsbD domain-containing protein [Thermodesulfobacteriota bacterium]
MIKVLISAFLLSLSSIFSLAQVFPPSVEAKLVSNADLVEPGDTFNLGVVFAIEPGWHIYWKNPGASGLATQVDFSVPQGFAIGNLNWPIPSSIKNPQGGIDYGYEQSLLLWSNIKVPDGAKIKDSHRISVNVSWVSCKDICVPGSKTLIYDLKLGDETKQNGSSIFTAWSNKLPTDINKTKKTFDVKVDTTKVKAKLYRVNLTIQSDTKLMSPQFFPNPGENISIQDISYQTLSGDKGFVISLDVIEKNKGSVKNAELDGLIVYNDQVGDRSALAITIDLDEI